MIEGVLKPGQKVVAIEDLFSTGGSSLKAALAIREAGGEMLGVLSIFTYQFDQCAQSFAELGIPIGSLSNYSSLLDVALEPDGLPHRTSRCCSRGGPTLPHSVKLKWKQRSSLSHKAKGCFFHHRGLVAIRHPRRVLNVLAVECNIRLRTAVGLRCFVILDKRRSRTGRHQDKNPDQPFFIPAFRPHPCTILCIFII